MLRHPLVRAVSVFEYAMEMYPSARFEARKRAAQRSGRCDPQLLHDYWVHVRANGHVDNHDLPQSAFLPFCNVPLCRVGEVHNAAV